MNGDLGADETLDANVVDSPTAAPAVIIFEPAATLNTGNIEDPTFTAPMADRI